MIAVLFAGHGAEHPGMGGELLAADDPLVELGGRLGGFDAAGLLRRGGPALHRTQVVQPLLTAVNLTILRAVAAAGVSWELCLGHSLGELAAWAATGALTPEAAVALAARRGAILAARAREAPGAMLELRLADERLAEALALGRAQGIVDPAVHNAPGRWVLSGERPALAAIAKRFEGRFVAGEGAWHSRLMAAGVPAFRAAVAAAGAGRRELGIIANEHGRLLGPSEDEDQSEDDFVELFVAQMTGTVRWAACTRTLAHLRVRDAVLIGPGKLLASLLHANVGDRIGAGELRIHRVESRRDLDRLVEVLA